jgi:hypothetical protein
VRQKSVKNEEWTPFFHLVFFPYLATQRKEPPNFQCFGVVAAPSMGKYKIAIQDGNLEPLYYIEVSILSVFSAFSENYFLFNPINRKTIYFFSENQQFFYILARIIRCSLVFVLTSFPQFIANGFFFIKQKGGELWKFTLYTNSIPHLNGP